jgi:hypothetical protein
VLSSVVLLFCCSVVLLFCCSVVLLFCVVREAGAEAALQLRCRPEISPSPSAPLTASSLCSAGVLRHADLCGLQKAGRDLPVVPQGFPVMVPLHLHRHDANENDTT